MIEEIKKEELTKEELIEEIKRLISVDGSTTEINPNYLEYFTLEELMEMKAGLICKKEDIIASTEEYVDELYDKLAL
ncbi:MAG: hypothetical protein WA945_04685 [Arcobacteraceae bacterium]